VSDKLMEILRHHSGSHTIIGDRRCGCRQRFVGVADHAAHVAEILREAFKPAAYVLTHQNPGSGALVPHLSEAGTYHATLEDARRGARLPQYPDGPIVLVRVFALHEVPDALEGGE